MTAHDPKVTRAAEAISRPSFPAKHPLPASNLEQFAQGLVVFTPSGREIDALIARARVDLAGLARTDIVHRVIAQNPDAMWAIARRDKFNPAAPSGQGFIAFLLLNDAGVRRLLEGTFDASNPDPELLSAQNQKPAGIYVWCMHAREGLAAGIPLAFEKMWTPLYHDADLYARAVTVDGQRFLETMGFKRGATYRDLATSHLHMYRRSRSTPTDLPLYDRYQATAREGELSVTVARSIEDMMRIIAIRSAVYIAEQECPYLEEFDGNDFCATHLLGYVGNEPVGCLRIRYFADFAKIERLAVRKEFRNTRLSFHIVRAAIELCRVKGYQVLYGHAQRRLVNFWSRFGFRVFDGAQDLVFSDFDYVEIRLDAERHPQAITIGVDPYMMIRPEGRWHLSGVLENSSNRPVTRPSVERTNA